MIHQIEARFCFSSCNFVWSFSIWFLVS